MPFCECGNSFERKGRGNLRKYCPSCTEKNKHRSYSRLWEKLHAAEIRLKAQADQSGNPRIFRAAEYSQDYLRRLIPG